MDCQLSSFCHLEVTFLLLQACHLLKTWNSDLVNPPSEPLSPFLFSMNKITINPKRNRKKKVAIKDLTLQKPKPVNYCKDNKYKRSRTLVGDLKMRNELMTEFTIYLFR